MQGEVNPQTHDELVRAMQRDPTLRVFDRRVDEDLFVKLKPHKDPRKPAVAFIDDSTGALWSRNAIAIEGGPEIKNKKLPRLIVEEDLAAGSRGGSAQGEIIG